MLHSMRRYQKRLEKLLDHDSLETNWTKETNCFKTRLLHLQLERLIHLIVTLTVGLAALITCFASISYPILPLYILNAIFLILFFAYILYYRKLENFTQNWYVLLEKLEVKK